MQFFFNKKNFSWSSIGMNPGALVMFLFFLCNTAMAESYRPAEAPGSREEHSDNKAPKSIKSKTLNYFFCDFQFMNKFLSRVSKPYLFSIEYDKDNKLMLSENMRSMKCETDTFLFTKVQQVIDRYNLTEKNGLYSVTRGLPTEYGPYSMNAKYASGEELNFVCNMDPSENWIADLMDLFAEEFAKNGDERLLPPPDSKVLTRINICYADGDNMVECTQMYVKDEINIVTRVWNRNHPEDALEKFQLATADIYKGLQEIIESEKLKYYAERRVSSSAEAKQSPYFLEFRLEYKEGNQMMGNLSTVRNDYDKVKSILERMVSYINHYADSDKAVVK